MSGNVLNLAKYHVFFTLEQNFHQLLYKWDIASPKCETKYSLFSALEIEHILPGGEYFANLWKKTLVIG